MTFAHCFYLLKNSFSKGDLPGYEAHRLFLPNGRNDDLGYVPKTALLSGVILLLYPIKGRIHILFIKRTDDNGVHSGQIGFPGGRYSKEDGDDLLLDTAIRECKEEIGVEIKKENIIGKLTPLYINPSNYLVYPFVALLSYTPNFNLSSDEVEYTIEIPLDYLLSADTKYANFKTKNGSINALCFDYENNLIWGASAMILNELVLIVNG